MSATNNTPGTGRSQQAALPSNGTQAIVVASSLTTTQHPAHAGYSVTNLPELLFRLEPPAAWSDPVYNVLRDQSGQVRMKPNGQPYPDFPWLPIQISIQPEPFLLEFWNRKHPDCSYADFEIRMRPGPNERLPARNTLNMRRIREIRLPFNIPSWLQKGEKVTITDCLIFESLSLNSVRQNTVLPVRPWGLIKPTLAGPSALAVNNQNAINPIAPPAPAAPLPLGIFTDGRATHVPSAKLEAVRDLTAYLQDTAFERMLAHWIFLRDQEKPSWWNEHRQNDVDTINVPLLQAVPYLAREWIKECVRDAAEPQNRLTIPPLSVLPNTARGWVSACIRDGRARSPIATAVMVGGQLDAISSCNVEGPEDSYHSNFSVSLHFNSEKAPSEEEAIGGSLDSSDASSTSEDDRVSNSAPEISEQTEATWTEHWKRHYRAKAVAEVLRTGQSNEAVKLPEHTAKVVTSNRRVLIFKNVIVLPEDDSEEGQGRASKRRRTELLEIQPPNLQ